MAKKYELSPMMQHYQELKLQNPDCIILYRLGDFYEMFFEDAKVVSRALGLTLTGRDCGLENKAPMCGVPAKSLDMYLAKLMEAGFKVAVCEQLTDPSKGPVERGVVRITTPGTIMESGLLESPSNNYLAVLYKDRDSVGISYIDISTGEFKLCEFNDNIILNINDMLSMIQPKEILANEELRLIEDDLPAVKSQSVPKFSYIDKSCFDFKACQERVFAQLNISSLKEINCTTKQNAIISAGALLDYVIKTQKRNLPHINTLEIIDTRKFMQIDSNTRRNLELCENSKDRGKKGTLLWVLDKTKTNMGKRTLKSFIDNPLVNEAEINYRLNGVEECVRNIVAREQIKDLLNEVHDIERLTGRISYDSISPKDCVALRASLAIIPQLKQILLRFNSKIISDITNSLGDFSDIYNMLESSIKDDSPNNYKDGNFIKKGFNAELDRIIELQTDSTSLLNRLEMSEKEVTGIKTLKVGYNRIFGYYIEVPKGSIDLVPFRYVRKQTLANGERFITEELKGIEDEILKASDRKQEIEEELYSLIKEKLSLRVADLQESARAIGLLDTLISFATIAVERNYVKPIITKNNTKLEIIEGRHPVVETIVKNEFVPNDTLMDNNEARTMLITGPNMAGKSTYMRQVALITLMAQIGCFVPAKSAKISIVDRIFTRIGASDDLMFGQSTFMVEMSEVSNILRYATNNSLVILDEIGRGTSTFDGLSIAWSVMEYISKHYLCKTLFSTHFHELTDLEGLIDGIKNYKILVKEFDNNIIFLRKITRGSANRSFGIEVASLAELPQEVLDRAKQILHSLEQHDLNKDLINNTFKNDGEDKEKANYRKALNEIASILTDLDINKLTPLNAFDTLIQLKNYLKKE